MLETQSEGAGGGWGEAWVSADFDAAGSALGGPAQTPDAGLEYQEGFLWPTGKD